MEALEHRHVPVHRGSGVAAVEQVRLVGHYRVAVDIVNRRDTDGFEKGDVSLEVGGVGRHRQRRASALDTQIRQVLLNLFLHASLP